LGSTVGFDGQVMVAPEALAVAAIASNIAARITVVTRPTMLTLCHLLSDVEDRRRGSDHLA
jgi:hypothetical protein